MSAEQLVSAGVLDMEGAQQYLRVSRSTLYNWIKAEEIATVRIGDRLLFPKLELDRILAKNLKPAKKDAQS